MRPSYEELEDEVRVLRQRLDEVLSIAVAERIRRFVRVAPQEARILAFLHGREMASKDAIYTAAFETAGGDGPLPGIVHVTIFKLRRKLRAGGVPGQIVTVGRAGYEISQTMRSWLTERLAA